MARAIVRLTLFRGEFSNRVRAYEKRVLFRAGGFTKGVLNRRIRRSKKKKSKPGEFPRAHVPGRATGIKAIFFDVLLGFAQSNVVIGPIKLRRKRPKQSSSRRVTVRGKKVVPQLLNEGGGAIVQTEFVSGATQRKATHYEARPFKDLTAPIANNFLREAMRTTSEGFRF